MSIYHKGDYELMCDEIVNKKKELEKEEKELKRVIELCKKSKFKYGKDDELTLEQLIELIKIEKKNNVDEFITLFPPVGIKGVKISQSHVFEALWIIIFVLNLDDLIDLSKEKRIFYENLEKGGDIAIDGINKKVSEFLKKTSVNASRKGGIVDIYFEHVLKDSTKSIQYKNFACEGGCDIIDTDPSNIVKSTKFMYSSKFYLKEKGVGYYDINDIFTEAIHKINEKVENFKIGVLVNNKSDLFDKCRNSVKIATKILNRDISFDMNDLNIYYKRLLEFIHSKHSYDSVAKRELELQPRFHQEYVINYTVKNIEKGHYKYVWGAVPRSGKSYMIGGLIAKYKHSVKNVLIILGAVSETHTQFFEMFDKFKGSFPGYKITDIRDEKKSKEKYKNIDKNGKNIVIISQQQLWQKTGNEDTIVKEISELLKEKEKMVFFDEIHQGAGSNSEAQIHLLKKYIFKDKKLDFPFIMVTATFSKPVLKYKELGNVAPLIVQWTYDMIQNMKDIANPVTLNYIKNELLQELDGELKSSIFIELIEKYKNTGKPMGDLEYEYSMYPILNVICPDLTANSSTGFNDIRENNNEHTDLNIKDIFDLTKLKKGETNPLKKLLKYIQETVYRDFLLNQFGFNVLNKQHTQLWFMPTKLSKSKNNEDIGFVEPLMRYIIFELLKIPDFQNNFCFIILHSKKIEKIEYSDIKNLYNNKNNKQIQDVHRLEFPNKEENILKDIEGNQICFSTKCLNGNDDKECIRQEECNAYKMGKSVIILTGQKMRLGVSLPCVDIALHMDPIESADIIYQSMFRVLTERNGKKNAYFFDLLKNRFIKFLYKYENNVNFGKKPTTGSQRLDKAIQLLYSINLNGIRLKDDTTEYIKIYKKLVNELGFNNEDTFKKKTSEYENNNDISKTIIEMVDDITINHLYKIIEDQKFDNVKFDKNINSVIHSRTTPLVPTTIKKLSDDDNDDGDDGDGDGDDGDGDDGNVDVTETSQPSITIEKKRETVKEYLLNILTLYILFNNDSIFSNDEEQYNKCNMEEIEKGFDEFYKVLDKNPNEYTNIEDFINDYCNNTSKNIIDCYFLQSLKLNKIIEKEKEKEKSEINQLNKVILNFINEKEEQINKRLRNEDNIEKKKEIKKEKDDFIQTQKEEQIKKIQDIKDKYNLIIKNILKNIIEESLKLLDNNRDFFKIIIENFNDDQIKKNEFFQLYCNIRDNILMVKKENIKNKKNIVEYNDDEKLIKEYPDCSKLFIDNEKILSIIREHLTVRKTEKEEQGEVFTPVSLACEMLDKLPKEVWNNPNLKWLDPANGIGNFPIIAYYKLMVGLKDVDGYTDEEFRSKHIIENMLYMIEINPINSEVCKKIFKMIDNQANPNIVSADFLNENATWKNVLKIDKFDIIIGNPPYNSGGIRSKNEITKEGTETIWPDFVKNSLALLKNEDSYLLFIHPGSWISLQDKKRSDMLLNKQLLYLRFYNYKQANSLFGNQSGKIPLTYYLLKNVNSKADTEIYDIPTSKFFKYNIYENNFVPTESVNMWKKIHEFTKKYGSLQSKYYNSKRPIRKPSVLLSKENPYPLITIKEKDIKVMYYNENLSQNSNKKLILPNFSMGYPILDPFGTLYVSSNMMHIIHYDNNINSLKQIQNYFYTNLIFYIINTLKLKQNFFSNKIFEIVPDITKITSEENITDELLIKLFGLSEEDLIGYEKYKLYGEGRLSPEKIAEFKNFDIKDKLTDDQYDLFIDSTVSVKTGSKSNGGTIKRYKKKINKSLKKN
jgi:hypothetical protein